MGIKAASVFVFVLLLGVTAVYGADIIVGGNSGWNQGFNYDTWAASQTFTVGDNLVFNYGGNHRVDEVTEANYKSCSSSSPIKSESGGRTSIPLSAPGPRYFICPTPGHCEAGMKLQITVAAANSTPGATPSPPSTSPPPPSPSGAAAVFLGFKGLIFGASVVSLLAL